MPWKPSRSSRYWAQDQQDGNAYAEPCRPPPGPITARASDRDEGGVREDPGDHGALKVCPLDDFLAGSPAAGDPSEAADQEADSSYEQEQGQRQRQPARDTTPIVNRRGLLVECCCNRVRRSEFLDGQRDRFIASFAEPQVGSDAIIEVPLNLLQDAASSLPRHDEGDTHASQVLLDRVAVPHVISLRTPSTQALNSFHERISSSRAALPSAVSSYRRLRLPSIVSVELATRPVASSLCSAG